MQIRVRLPEPYGLGRVNCANLSLRDKTCLSISRLNKGESLSHVFAEHQFRINRLRQSERSNHLFGGFAIKSMLKAGWFGDVLRQQVSTGCGCGPNPFDGKPVWTFWTEARRRQVFTTEFANNALFLIKWLALAYVLEALLVTYIPASLIAGLVGGEGVVPIAIAAIVGMPAYLNSYVAPPLLSGLMEQGMSAGAAMSFMVAGAVSSVPAMAAVWSLVKKQVFATYLALGVSGAIASGVIFQILV